MLHRTGHDNFLDKFSFQRTRMLQIQRDLKNRQKTRSNERYVVRPTLSASRPFFFFLQILS